MSRAWPLFLLIPAMGCGPQYELSAEEQALADSFDHYPEFAAMVEDAEGFELYEGLPHQMLDQELYDSEKESQETVVIKDYDFYAGPVVISKDEREELVEMFVIKRNFRAFSGTKACGGFHPDFAIDFESNGERVVVQFCFGCSEVRAVSGGREMYCEMTERGKTKLKSFFKPFHTNRPEGAANYWK